MIDFSQNHFDLFGLPMRFDVDRGALAASYRALQQAVHPDRFATSGEHDRRLSLQAAMHVNEGHATLRDDLARARYLLEINGVSVDPQATVSDPAFLMEQMALREALAGVADSPDPRDSVARLLERIDLQLRDLVSDLSALFARSTDEALAEAALRVQRMQFLRRLQDEATAIEADLDEGR